MNISISSSLHRAVAAHSPTDNLRKADGFAQLLTSGEQLLFFNNLNTLNLRVGASGLKVELIILLSVNDGNTENRKKNLIKRL